MLPSILVIAPGHELRRSLAFFLEAEGYVVTSHSEVPGAQCGRGYDAVVLDQKAAGRSPPTVLSLCQSAPVVLLSGGAPDWLRDTVQRVVETPVIGDALSVAIRETITAGGRH